MHVVTARRAIVITDFESVYPTREQFESTAAQLAPWASIANDCEEPHDVTEMCMHFCGDEIFHRSNCGDFALIFLKSLRNFGYAPILHCRISPHCVVLYRAINRLPPPCPPRMTCTQNSVIRLATGFDARTFCASLKLHQQGRHDPWTLP
jgi:hypothetical protein